MDTEYRTHLKDAKVPTDVHTINYATIKTQRLMSIDLP